MGNLELCEDVGGGEGQLDHRINGFFGMRARGRELVPLPVTHVAVADHQKHHEESAYKSQEEDPDDGPGQTGSHQSCNETVHDVEILHVQAETTPTVILYVGWGAKIRKLMNL